MPLSSRLPTDHVQYVLVEQVDHADEEKYARHYDESQLRDHPVRVWWDIPALDNFIRLLPYAAHREHVSNECKSAYLPEKQADER